MLHPLFIDIAIITCRDNVRKSIIENRLECESNHAFGTGSPGDPQCLLPMQPGGSSSICDCSRTAKNNQNQSSASLLRPQGFPWLVAIGTVLEVVAWNTVLGRRTNLVLVARRVFHSPLLQSPPVLAHSDLSDSRRGRIRV